MANPPLRTNAALDAVASDFIDMALKTEARKRQRAQTAEISQKTAQNILARANKGSVSFDALAELIPTEFAEIIGYNIRPCLLPNRASENQ